MNYEPVEVWKFREIRDYHEICLQWLRKTRETSVKWVYCLLVTTVYEGGIQKFPGWVDNEISKNKHAGSNTKGYGGKPY
jgi:hypothetical protein